MDIRLEKILFQRWYKNSQEAHEMMINIISYSENANQNHKETPLYTHWDVCNQEDGQ